MTRSFCVFGGLVVVVQWSELRVFHFCDAMGRFRRHNTSLRHINLEHNHIGDTGAAALREGLRCVNIHAHPRCLIVFSRCVFFFGNFRFVSIAPRAIHSAMGCRMTRCRVFF
jgi:hypothetical protein